jgi:hypothetical protein
VAKPAQPTTTQQAELPRNEVKEPSLAEEMNDEIPDFGNESAEVKAPPSPPNARRNLKKPSTKTSAKTTGKRRLTNLDAG